LVARSLVNSTRRNTSEPRRLLLVQRHEQVVQGLRQRRVGEGRIAQSSVGQFFHHGDFEHGHDFCMAMISPSSIPSAAAPSICFAAMHGGVTRSAKRNEIALRIIAGLATEFFVVYLEIRHRPAGLAFPTVSPQDLLPQRFVFRTEAQWTVLR
jgi:hypothetical protein